MPKILLVEDNDLNRDMLSRRFTGGGERTISKRAYDCEELPLEVARLLGAFAARGVPPGEERPR